MSEEVLKITEKREAQGNEEKERYTHLNAKFQRIARRDTKGTFHAKLGSIKNRNGLDLTEAEDIKKGWQEYMEELYKKDLHYEDNHDE